MNPPDALLDALAASPAGGPAVRPRRPSAGFMFAHPAHLLALGFGSGLSPVAPGTAGTLWAWLAFVALQPWMTDSRWALLLIATLLLGTWASTVTARHMQVLDPSAIVVDEIVAFWLVLWLVTPSSLLGQAVAFALFRYFDAAKPGPVGWADALCHRLDARRDRHAWRKAGLGIMFDDLVAAACTLLLIALWRAW
jgi:phosphatidylglycerophosphatase A